MPVPMDEFPVHQTPFSMRHVGTSDRNFYDRCYFNAFDPSGDVMLITGAGIYPNLGVKDAYALVRVGDEQYAVRMSDALDDDRLNQKIGPYRIEVIEPLEKVRVICDADSGKDVDGGTPPIGFDLTWEGSFPAVDEAHHYIQTGPRNILDTSRFAQVGSWSGTLRVAGQDGSVGRRRADPGHVLAVRPDALRRPPVDGDGPGEARRLPHAGRRDADVRGRPGRAAQLAGR
jgi:hypothetical protein